MTIDRSIPIPFYYQLKQIIAEQIASEKLRPGDMLPTEQQLQQQYEVSRTTVRQALRELELEGKVTRYRGRGTFVARPKVSHSPAREPSLTDHLLDEDRQLGWKVLEAVWLPASAMIASQLQIETAAQVFCLRRLRLENDEPIGYHLAYVAPNYAEALDEDAFAEGGSLRYLRKGDMLDGGYANRTLEAVPAGDEDATLLDVEKGAPMLLVQRLVFTHDGKPVEAFRGIYRGDRFRYHINNMGAVGPINA